MAQQRKAARSVRRAQLIEATIRALARKGFAALTVADVAKEAGLSTGIVIFHFNSKDELIAAVLDSLAAEYHDHWAECVAQAGPSPADRLKALILSDFDASVFTPERLAAWVAFWGETQGRPTYDKICSDLDAERRAVSERLCQELVTEGGYVLEPAIAMRTLEALCDGLWLDLAAQGGGQQHWASAEEARRVAMAALGILFPRHYSPDA
jgi:TetR/AcrR family transcriptional repressor of bet genes